MIETSLATAHDLIVEELALACREVIQKHMGILRVRDYELLREKLAQLVTFEPGIG